MQRLGLYSLLLSITSTLGAFNAGFSGSLVRYVSIFNAESKPEKAISLIGTLFSSLLAFFTILVVLLNWGSGELLKLMHLGASEAAEFNQLLLLASLVFLIGVLGGVFLSALEGLQKVYIKNYIVSAVAFSNLIISILLIPHYELKGLFIAYLISNGLAYLAAWIFLQMHLNRTIFFFPISWNKELFCLTFHYNITFQAISVSSLFYDPLLRILLVRFEGLPMAGIYELANKLISQARGILVAVNQSLVPVFAGLENQDSKTRMSLFKQSHRLIFAMGNLVFGMLAAVLPLISIVWIGSANLQLMVVVLILIPGWLFNTLSLPPYFANIGLGHLKPVLFHHLAMALIVPIFCYLSGLLGYKYGVVFSWSIGLMLCSVPLIFIFFHKHNLSLRHIAPSGFQWLVFSHIAIIMAWMAIWNKADALSIVECGGFFLFGLSLYLFSYWKAGFIKEAWHILKK